MQYILKKVFMPGWTSLARWIDFDYTHLLPLIAGLPRQLGYGLSYFRGFCYALVDYDWRDHATGVSYVRPRTYRALRLLLSERSKAICMYRTILRYMHHSREEWEACLFRRRIMQDIFRQSRVDHLMAIKTCYQEGRGLVMLSCHLDSFCLGMVLMGMHGLPVNVVNTVMIEDPRIHPAVRGFFQKKYRAMENLMNGRMPYYQTEMPYFEEALNADQMVVLMGDIPGSKSDCWINWLGRSFRMPLGAWHMARRTNSKIGAFVCIRTASGSYRVITCPPREVDFCSPINTLMPLYQFMEEWIRYYPERWISSDLLLPYGPPQF